MMYSSLGSYVSHRTRMRERIVAGVVGLALGLAGGMVMFLLGAAA